MGNLVLNGATSGQITVSPTAVAGTNTLTLPAKTGNIITSADSGTVTQTMLGTNVAGNGPAFSAYATIATSITPSVNKITLNVKLFDTANAFDAVTNYRFQPLVAGYYFLTGVASAPSAQIQAAIYKNGSLAVYGTFVGTTATSYSQVSNLLYLNGSTDYVELWAYAASTVTSNAGQPFIYFNGFLARSA